MALINTIREKSGVAVGAVAIGMLLFIVGSDLVGGRSRGIFGSDAQTVGEVNGEKIELPEFSKALQAAQQNFANQQGRQPDEQTTGYLRGQVWNQMLYKYTFLPEVQKLGLGVGPDELVDMVQGDNIDPSLRQSFTDPKTGQFDKNALLDFLRNIDKKAPEQRDSYYAFEDNLRDVQGPINKYNALLHNSVYVTSAEAKAYDKVQNAKASFRYLFVPYTSQSDSAFKPTDTQLRDYLERHRGRYKVEDGRSIEYIVVGETASKEDSAAIKQSMATLAGQFATAPNDSLFVRANSEQPYTGAYLGESQLPADLTKSKPLTIGKVYGPFAVGSTLALYKVTGERTKPMVQASHILFKTEATMTPDAKAAVKAKAQDILNKIKAGADFAAMAKEYGSDGTKDKGGDLGYFDKTSMVPEFSKAAFGAPGLGLLPTLVETSFGYHIIKVTGKKSEPTYQVASVLKAVQPSDATREAAYSKAEQLLADADNLEAFRKLPTKDKTLQKQEAKYVARDASSINNLQNVREIVRWAYGDGAESETKVGDIKKFDIGEQHIVAAVTDTRTKGTATVESIKPELTFAVRNELKAKAIMAKLQGKAGSLDDLAKAAGTGAVVQTADGVSAAQGVIPNVGAEPLAVGRAFILKPSQKSDPIQGEQGVLVVEGVSVQPAAPLADAKAVRQTLTQQRQQRQDGLIFQALKDNVKVVDNRSRFF